MQDQDGPLQNTMSPGPHHTPPSPYIARYSIGFPLDGGTPSITALSEVLPLREVVSKSRTNHAECFGSPRSVLMGHAPDLAIGIRKSLLDPLAGLFWPYMHGFEARDLEVPLRYTKSYDPVPQSSSFDRDPWFRYGGTAITNTHENAAGTHACCAAGKCSLAYPISEEEIAYNRIGPMGNKNGLVSATGHPGN
ncbi:uncharacterized protein LY79DRAFT_44556 [Colletotrichum navitas]|uniref:Uncharacterized protein n=1 Tax=Colletotrichum navitas TaxID=681940 RepID=A0AAD8UZY2_9PEZI|nr:uncharacterized protein LY79DRAFT_44556 [Colletotrichum navitas]KAK1572670.1 hypothetical protein LY79DRAFT_44556 [Colletotrichum navitas]